VSSKGGPTDSMSETKGKLFHRKQKKLQRETTSEKKRSKKKKEKHERSLEKGNVSGVCSSSFWNDWSEQKKEKGSQGEKRPPGAEVIKESNTMNTGASCPPIGGYLLRIEPRERNGGDDCLKKK